MKRSNLWRLVWIVGIYAILAVILYLVVLYKVQWEYKDLNTYLYFYDCNKSLCTSTTKQVDYYNKVLCEDNICPYITEIINNNLILKNDKSSWIYNYIDDKIVNNKYIDYRYIGNDLYIISNNEMKQGIINLSGDIIVDTKYDYIDDYKNGFVSYMQNSLYGIDITDDVNDVDANFENIVLINDKIFAGMKKNTYHIYSYGDINNENSFTYDFVYAYDDIILVINNKKIDILNVDLDSTLLMKIDTFYEYTTEKERDSLDIYSDNENIYFKVFVNETDYTTYKYNILSKKIV